MTEDKMNRPQEVGKYNKLPQLSLRPPPQQTLQ